jgi:hypothetical protein
MLFQNLPGGAEKTQGETSVNTFDALAEIRIEDIPNKAVTAAPTRSTLRCFGNFTQWTQPRNWIFQRDCQKSSQIFSRA